MIKCWETRNANNNNKLPYITLIHLPFINHQTSKKKENTENSGRRGRHELSSPEFILESAPTRDKAQPRIEVNVEPSEGIRAAGSPLCATCAVYPPPCVSGIFLLPSLAYLTLPPLLPSFLHTYPFSTRPVFLHRVHADRTIPSTTTASRMIIVVLAACQPNAKQRLEIPPLSSSSLRGGASPGGESSAAIVTRKAG